MHICSHFGSIPIETPCDKLGITKGLCPDLRPETYDQCKELTPFQLWYNKNRKDPTFRHLVKVAYKDWKGLVHISNKVVKKKEASIGASSGPGSAVVGSTCRPACANGKCDRGLTNQLIN